MNSLKNPSKTVIGYIIRDRDVAKSRVDSLAKDFYPLEEKFNLQKVFLSKLVLVMNW